MNIEEITPKLFDFNTELTPEDRGDMAELLIEMYGQYMPLEADKLTEIGDFVLLDRSDVGYFESGFKPFNGPINVTAGSLIFTVYRKVLI